MKMWRSIFKSISLSFVICISLAVPVSAANTYTIRFVDENGKVLKTKNVEADVGEKFSTTGKLQVRSTYFKDGVDYDLIDNNYPTAISKNQKVYTFKYKKHTDQDLTAVFNYIDVNGKVLESHKETLSSGKSVTFKPAATIKVNGKTYKTSDSSKTIKYDDNMSLTQDFVYVEETPDSSTYQVSVNYVDETNKTIKTESFNVGDSDYYYYAAVAFSLESNGEIKYYEAKDNNETLIHHEADDHEHITYTVHYNTVDTLREHDWNIFFYDAKTCKLIGSTTKKVSASGSDVVKGKDYKETMSVNGIKYTLNKSMKNSYHHDFGDTTDTYIFYNPEGYKNEDEEDKTITINYKNIKDISNDHVLKTKKVTVKPGSDTTINVDKKFDLDTKTYALVSGQADTFTHNYYSPMTTYTLYYRDIADKSSQFDVITTERIMKVTIDNGTTTTVVPGMTRYILVNADGTRVTAGTTRADGTLVPGATTAIPGTPTPAGTVTGNDNNTGNKKNKSIEGTEIDDVDTPAGRVKVDDTKQIKSYVIGSILLVLIIALAILFVIFKKRKEEREG